MTTELRQLSELPRQNATQVKNQWGEVVRLVRQNGSVAITNHSTVEMVLLQASTYEQLAQELHELKAQKQSQLDELAQRFEQRLAGLQQPQAPARVQALFGAKGKLGARRPKAGAAF
ncbi:type II toxin-antitoxin system prevent-host-death family antitoxin [Aquabacterium sp.]|uniref:type II toxin-antitoxin system prevent-host-death family antitoxin n=1 Tax=Aquabacterium sp. TaxID=1872578 RepID=UPI002BDAF1E3|nr:type II toxin-antitoxin system prevent-host-death family antitoxin [Aquabacterium sp.]HSW07349.1 type II toxin-antitoxin system prevent-host-death family antitoxin [Aquabacterium sp.]